MFWTFLLPIALAISCCHPVLAGWPSGTYGLFKAASGCPGGDADWYNGSRTFDTEDRDSHNYFSFDAGSNSYLAGSFKPNDITVEFCMKITHTNLEGNQTDWPKGTYCILKFGLCPFGFTEGSIFWDDDDYRNHDSTEGVLPDGKFDSNTQIDFCCRSDQVPGTAMTMPTSRPFVLLRYGYHCQQITDMDMTDVFVRWDDEDLANRDSASGHHPFDDGGSDDHKLHFCHYSYNGQIVG